MHRLLCSVGGLSINPVRRVQAYGIPYRGGKPDDITVLVSYVSKTEGASQPAASTNGAEAADAAEQPQSKL